MRTLEAQYQIENMEAVMQAANAVIKPKTNVASYKTGTLTGKNKFDIERALGFPPNVDDDPDKVRYSWAFTINGRECAIWDWKGSADQDVWSVYDPSRVLSIIM
jgi:hypothetical protein